MILYFSGTGNSLYVARSIASKTNDKLVCLREGLNLDIASERQIGLVYPSYCFNPPSYVVKCIKRLQFPQKAYFYIIVSCGAQVGNSIWTIKNLLSKKGITLQYSNKIRMPDSSALAFGRNPNVQKWKFNKYADRLSQIIDDVSRQKNRTYFDGWSFLGWMSNRQSVLKKVLPILTPAVDSNKCIGCGVCVQLCPTHNITLVESQGNKVESSKANIGSKCVQCLSCVHFCNQQAVQLNQKRTDKLYQYHHPAISIGEMMKN